MTATMEDVLNNEMLNNINSKSFTSDLCLQDDATQIWLPLPGSVRLPPLLLSSYFQTNK
jgi:hypothetical protein